MLASKDGCSGANVGDKESHGGEEVCPLDVSGWSTIIPKGSKKRHLIRRAKGERHNLENQSILDQMYNTLEELRKKHFKQLQL